MPRFRLVNFKDPYIGESLESDTLFEAQAEALEKLGWRVEEEGDDIPVYEDEEDDDDDMGDIRTYFPGYD